ARGARPPQRPYRPAFDALEIRDVPSATFTLVNDWGSGFQGQIVVKNDDRPSTIQSWTLQFDMPYAIDSIWNASVVSHVGSRYTVKAADWNQTLAPGATATFGFNGSPDRLTTPPGNYVLADGAAQGGVQAAVSYRVTNAWNSGSTAEIGITNQ